MKEIIFSDVHGDIKSLNELLDIECDKFSFLGDAVNFGNHYQELFCFERILEKADFVVGNHELGLLEKDSKYFNKHKKLIKSMPASRFLNGVLYTHMFDSRTYKKLKDCNIVFCGDTHKPEITSFNGKVNHHDLNQEVKIIQ